jgi:hypothetical protein
VCVLLVPRRCPRRGRFENRRSLALTQRRQWRCTVAPLCRAVLSDDLARPTRRTVPSERQAFSRSSSLKRSTYVGPHPPDCARQQQASSRKPLAHSRLLGRPALGEPPLRLPRLPNDLLRRVHVSLRPSASLVHSRGQVELSKHRSEFTCSGQDTRLTEAQLRRHRCGIQHKVAPTSAATDYSIRYRPSVQRTAFPTRSVSERMVAERFSPSLSSRPYISASRRSAIAR